MAFKKKRDSYSGTESSLALGLWHYHCNSSHPYLVLYTCNFPSWKSPQSYWI